MSGGNGWVTMIWPRAGTTAPSGSSGRSVGVQAFVVLLAGLSIVLGGGGGDAPGSDDDGRGPRRPQPPRTPTELHVSWPDFERQFAKHVEALRAGDKVTT